jgi:hypothetical protein
MTGINGRHDMAPCELRHREETPMATDDEQITDDTTAARAHAVAAARRMVREHNAGHKCHEWLDGGRCAVCDRVAMPYRVGDVVRVARECGGNAPGSHAVVIQLYDRERQRGDQSGATLLFPNGFADGFSPDDLAIFGVTFVRHVDALEAYAWRNVGQVDADFRAGHFDEAWP